MAHKTGSKLPWKIFYVDDLVLLAESEEKSKQK